MYGDLFDVNLRQNTVNKLSMWWRDLSNLGSSCGFGSNWFVAATKKRLGVGDTVKFCTSSVERFVLSVIYGVC